MNFRIKGVKGMWGVHKRGHLSLIRCHCGEKSRTRYLHTRIQRLVSLMSTNMPFWTLDFLTEPECLSLLTIAS